MLQESTHFRLGSLLISDQFAQPRVTWSKCILQMSHSQISAKLMQAVLKYEFFSSLYPPKTLCLVCIPIETVRDENESVKGTYVLFVTFFACSCLI